MGRGSPLSRLDVAVQEISMTRGHMGPPLVPTARARRSRRWRTPRPPRGRCRGRDRCRCAAVRPDSRCAGPSPPGASSFRPVTAQTALACCPSLDFAWSGRRVTRNFHRHRARRNAQFAHSSCNCPNYSHSVNFILVNNADNCAAMVFVLMKPPSRTPFRPAAARLRNARTAQETGVPGAKARNPPARVPETMNRTCIPPWAD